MIIPPTTTQPLPVGRDVRLGSEKARHLYRMGVGAQREEGTIDVLANDRGQATRIAERAGYVVRDVNMIG